MFRLLVLLALVLAACSASPELVGTDRSIEGSQATATSVAPAGPPQAADREQMPAYRSSVQPIGSALLDRMKYSHRPGCPVSSTELRHLRLSFVGFDGKAQIGEIVVHRDHATAVAGAFEQLYEARWPIQEMRLVDDYGGDDERSMAANNTSGYNCRTIAGGGSWSEHAYGAAIDINPVQNPFAAGASIAPPAGQQFAFIDRSASTIFPPGVIREDDVVVEAFARIGWQWGGDWSNSKDYQHFSASGR